MDLQDGCDSCRAALGLAFDSPLKKESRLSFSALSAVDGGPTLLSDLTENEREPVLGLRGPGDAGDVWGSMLATAAEISVDLGSD